MTERTALQTAAAVRSRATTALAETEAAIARIEAEKGEIINAKGNAEEELVY